MYTDVADDERVHVEYAIIHQLFQYEYVVEDAH